ncbi:hypothetical protein D3C84_861830 [compost metagenome]
MNTDDIDHLLPVIERLAIQGQQSVTGFQAGSLRRAFRIEFRQHRRQRRTPWANTQRANRIRLVSALEPFIQHQLTRRIRCGTLLTNQQLK